MNTLLSSAQQAQLEQFRSYARQHLAPIVDNLVTREAPLKEFLQKLGQQGFLGLNVPKEFGGTGANLLDTVLLVESLAELEPGLGLSIGSHVAVIETLKKFATDKQKAKYLPLLARGEIFATTAFSEQNAGTDFEAVECTAGGADEAVINGVKKWVVTGDFAALFLVLVKSANGELVVLLADRPETGSTFKFALDHKLIGLRSAYVNDVEFSGLTVPAENKLQGNGKDVALYAMDVAKVVLAAAGVGLIDGATNIALDHARARSQFGTTIGQFQGVQWKLADMECERNAARLLVYRAAVSIEEAPEQFRGYSSMCKWYAARAARLHSGEALQILGASGLEESNPIGRLYYDGKAIEIAQGTSEFQKMLLVKELNI